MARICIFLINLYRKYISRYTKPRCRFSPTCSSYAVESYQKFGFMNFDLCIIYSKFNACSNDNLFKKRINSQYITFIIYPLNY